MTYAITLEKFRSTYGELEFLYREHYAEMCERLNSQGIETSAYKPRLDQYDIASDGGWLLTFVLRFEGKAVGYCNIYLTNDMHNMDFIAQEDTIFVTKAHRNGIGKKLVSFVLDELKKRGVKRLICNAMTDLRVAKLWRRMGFKDMATTMCFTF